MLVLFIIGRVAALAAESERTHETESTPWRR